MKGILVALANTLVVALFIAIGIDDGNVVEATVIISMMGFIPAMLVGATLGHYGESMQTQNRRVMLVCMIAVACSMVTFLGMMFELTQLVVVSCIPTAAGCSILERWTRAKRDDALPFARVA